MEVRWLEDFLALARTRHFSRAAELQHVTQPTFSRRIKLLEETMGTTLVDRQTLPLSLTPAGEVFREMCERVTRDVRDTRERIAQLESEASNRFSVGATQALFSHFFAGWLAETGLEERLQFNLKATNWLGEDFFDALDSGDCDLVLCYWHDQLPWQERWDSDYYQWLTLASECAVPLSVADDQGQPRFTLPGTEDQPVPVIAYHPRGFIAPAVAARTAASRPPAHLLPLNESAHSSSVKTLVAQGFGMGWLPHRVTEKSEHYGRLVRAGDERWDIALEIRLVRLRTPRSDGLATLWNELEDHYARTGTPRPTMPAS
ncbi:LysR family transcriptional regulator [Marinobacter xestospongiae]|uniref:LysR family transcriptional regulator n=1 Tax=Marinobacter xestospongiae TaxID=994319 RepID=A0ABU3VWI0_9GAMM|nr:LysR family transcriptional regulator [Marinobacter xestospongiae]MCG8519100.1 LysR family transcriptional regulator [Pseudomonadales bacterium]MCK7567805.1 LysR family transcriptional regulator [Marinobacter xestospongiae]MDV2078362.1 LysR family transcriptional regulator [Marinobacter xestospongiae]